MKKKLIARLIPAVVTAAIMFSGTPPVHADTTQAGTVTACFNDVHPSNFFYSPVYWAKANGITSGTSGSTYSPDQPCTRGQMVTFLWRLAGSPKSDWKTSFKDVSANSPYAKAIQWADDIMLTQGTGPNTFSPNQPCTRGQMAAFLWRYSNSPQTTSNTGFVDVSTSSWYAQPVAWAKSKGITSGTDATHYSPDAPCTRGQMAAFLYRMNGSPKVTVNTPTPSVTPTPSPSPSTDPSNEGKEQPGKGPREEGNENYGHWVTQNALMCNGCGEYFWDGTDYGYSQRITNGFHDHGSLTSVIDHDFWVWDDIPRMEDPNSGKPFYSETDWQHYVQALIDLNKQFDKCGIPDNEENRQYMAKITSMSWSKNAIAPTK